MKSVRAAVVFGFVLLLNPAGQAEDAPGKLPKDGWWARYFVTMKHEFNGETHEGTFKRTYSLVGTATENGESCRWVEFKSVEELGGKERVQVVKLLIPEKDLLESDRPVDRLMRGWTKNDDEVKAAPADGGFAFEMLIFPGLRRKAEMVDKQKVVEYQHGRLEIAQGQAGKRKGKTRPAPRFMKGKVIISSEFEFTVWADPAVAPGFAAAKTRFTVFFDDVLNSVRTDEWTIEDIGTDAKSNLPENN